MAALDELLAIAAARLAPLPSAPDRARLVALSPRVGKGSFAILAGPGVVRSGNVAGLRALAAMTGCGVVNTWGAKGAFAWDDPFHLGTAGLQARDFELAGLEGIDTLVTTGLDPLEVPTRPWEPRAAVVDIPVERLASAAGSWPAPAAVAPSRPALYTELAAALAPLYASAAAPLTPARAAADLAAARPPGGVVVADPGPAGLWVARALPTREPGSVVVPATKTRGFAAAAALVAARRRGRRGRGPAAIAVTHAPVGEETEAVLDRARSEGAHVVLEVWGADALPLDPSERLARLATALATPGVNVLELAVDLALTRVLVEVAGEVVAWR